MEVDFLVVGAGIAGASVGYWLAPHGRTLVLERESFPGYHSTGRSAAHFIDTYGTAHVRALSRASRAFFEAPPEGFARNPLVRRRDILVVGAADAPAATQEAYLERRSAAPATRLLSPDEARAWVPVLRPDCTGHCIHEAGGADIDVHEVHQGFLAGIRRSGGRIECDAEVTAIEREGVGWRVAYGGREVRASKLVNAAGAWAEQVAALAGAPPIGLVPRRRSAFTFAPPPGLDIRDWPLVIAVDDGWYFKPDAGVLLGSPANADPVVAHDVQPEELDIATGIHRIEQATTLTIRRPLRVWAGLRSFVDDGDLVGGADPAVPGFFWVAGQGGYGIQTSPAMGEACAALVRGEPIPERLQAQGISAAALSPSRLPTRRVSAPRA